MKKIGILGHFAFGKETTSGQIIKTRIIGDELSRRFCQGEVTLKDTCGGWGLLLNLPWSIIYLLWTHRNIIIMPAHHGIRIIAPILSLLNLFFQRKTHYVVIGGWLPELARQSTIIRICLGQFHGIYVETLSMQQKLLELNIRNVFVMPNCKPLNIIQEKDLPQITPPPYKLCTFSRVMKSKGIEDAVCAVKTFNQTAGKKIYTLDIYGQIEKGEEKWFEQLMQEQRDDICYKGIIAFDKSTEVLKNYLALLFPTYYEGEAFAGTIIDAMASGLPTIASDWHENPTIISHEKTGLLFPTHSLKALINILDKIANRGMSLQRMRINCITEARKYLPENVINILTDNLA